MKIPSGQQPSLGKIGLVVLQEIFICILLWILGYILWFLLYEWGWVPLAASVLIPTIAAFLYFPLGVVLAFTGPSKFQQPKWQAELLFLGLMLVVAAALAILWPYIGGPLSTWLKAESASYGH